MLTIFQSDFYFSVLGVMAVLAVFVFVALLKITAPYGMAYSSKWGPSVANRWGWIMMELPAFAFMLWIWLGSERAWQPGAVVCVGLFLIHYFNRTFVFPLRMKGKSRMPLAIVLCGMIFNSVNAYLIGAWLFYLAPADQYSASWLLSWQFLIGFPVFLLGMYINLDSDRRVRALRKPGDTRHYIPYGGMFRYVTSANYFGELTEWTGYALLTFSPGAVMFVVWTFANLAPRARKLHSRYISEFGDQYSRLNRRYIIPKIF